MSSTCIILNWSGGEVIVLKSAVRAQVRAPKSCRIHTKFIYKFLGCNSMYSYTVSAELKMHTKLRIYYRFSRM